MELRKKIEKEMQLLESEIRELEVKRTRSMSALMECLISKRAPDEIEMQYFRRYTEEIDGKRDKLIALTEQLKSMT